MSELNVYTKLLNQQNNTDSLFLYSNKRLVDRGYHTSSSKPAMLPQLTDDYSPTILHHKNIVQDLQDDSDIQEPLHASNCTPNTVTPHQIMHSSKDKYINSEGRSSITNLELSLNERLLGATSTKSNIGFVYFDLFEEYDIMLSNTQRNVVSTFHKLMKHYYFLMLFVCFKE